MEYNLLYKNQLVDNIYEACTCCYDNTKELDYLQKKSYIAKRINSGHESILEHGKLAIIFKGITKPNQIANVIGYEYSKWLEFYTTELENGTYNLIVNGSIRAYKHFLTHITEDTYDTDIIAKSIISILLHNTPKELYGEYYMIEDFLETHDFVDVEPDAIDIYNCRSGIFYDNIFVKEIHDVPLNKPDVKKEVIVGIDGINLAPRPSLGYENALEYLSQEGFNAYEIIDNIIPVTIVFKNMSRTATHQLVRHRNAITQESQRYVNASNASFTIPVPTYKDKKFDVTLFGNTSNVSLEELATELTNIYRQLFAQGLKKEEARAFLPSNINCGRLYMTYTLATLKAFIKLRTDPHAQYEIRKYATAIKEVMDTLDL